MIKGSCPNGAPIATDIEAQKGTVWYLAHETIRNRPIRTFAIDVVSRLIFRCNVVSKNSRIQLQPCIHQKMKPSELGNAIHLGSRRKLIAAALYCLIVISQVKAREEPPAIRIASVPVPIAHWKLDDVGSEARDSIGIHHGTIHGAVSREGKHGKALLFDRAKGDCVSIPHSPEFEIGTFTVSAWVWLTKEPTFSGVLGTRLGGEFNFDMKVNTDKVHGDIGDGIRWVDTKINFYKDDVGTNRQGGDLEIRRWYLITFVVDNEKKECRLYLDADRKKTIAFKGEPRLMRPSQTMQIGNTGTNEFMDGLIDDVRIWKHALTDEQVRGLIE